MAKYNKNKYTKNFLHLIKLTTSIYNKSKNKSVQNA